MTDKTRGASPNRRDFLRLAGLGAGAAGAVAVVSATGAAAAEPVREDESKQSSYRETAHVKTVYALSRF